VSAESSVSQGRVGVAAPGDDCRFFEPQRRVDRRRLERRAKIDGVRSTLGWIGVVIVFGLTALFVAMFSMGYRTYAITGGSMEGAIARGSLIVDEVVPVSWLKVGDIITYCPPEQTKLVTHRIVSIEQDKAGETVFHTKGDANEAVDPWTFTLDQDRQARCVFHVRYLGYVLVTLGTPVMRSIVLGLLALLLALTIFVRLLRRSRADLDPIATVMAGSPSAPEAGGLPRRCDRYSRK
jgi:signal peptidase I